MDIDIHVYTHMCVHIYMRIYTCISICMLPLHSAGMVTCKHAAWGLGRGF
uniref:Uncharacterized protein n=1 Tax=Anguilla anguilla TaxID=7936 RepID=A0A0E9U0W2_ANGAN